MEVHKLSVIQQKMFDILSDGKLHTRKELFACLSDDLSQMSAIKPHLCAIRKVIRPAGRDVICQYLDRQFRYRMVILLPSSRE